MSQFIRTSGIALALVGAMVLCVPGTPAIAQEEHTKNKRKSTWDKHTKRRPGQRGKKSKIPPNPNKRPRVGNRGGFITPKAAGGMVAAEGAAYLISLSYEYNQLVTGTVNDPDFRFRDQDEADLIGLNVLSSGYWNGVWDYWTGR